MQYTDVINKVVKLKAKLKPISETFQEGIKRDKQFNKMKTTLK